MTQQWKTCLFFFFFKEANSFATHTCLKLIHQMLQISLKHRLDSYVSSWAGRVLFSQDTPRWYRWGDGTFPRRGPMVQSGGLWKKTRRPQAFWAPGPCKKRQSPPGQPGTLQKHEILPILPGFPLSYAQKLNISIAKYSRPRRQSDYSFDRESSKVGTIGESVFQAHCWPGGSLTPASEAQGSCSLLAEAQCKPHK